MRILLVEQGHSLIHGRACKKALADLGHQVIYFSWDQLFNRKELIINQFLKKVQFRLCNGPVIQKINNNLLETVRNTSPDVIWIYRGEPIWPKTLLKIKSFYPGIFLVGYHNDDPFGVSNSEQSFKNYRESILLFDLVFAYRPKNVTDFLACGAKQVQLLPPYFIPWIHYPVNLSPEEELKYACDVAFVGHYEEDGRIDLIERVINKKVDFKLYGPEWYRAQRRSKTLQSLGHVEAPIGIDYTKAICGAKIVLAFHSNRNNDVYTRRNFEIPACGAFMLSKYSDWLASTFEQGVDAEYFTNGGELLEKIDFYIKHVLLRKMIADSGYKKVWDAKHDIINRMLYLVQCIDNLMQSAGPGKQDWTLHNWKSCSIMNPRRSSYEQKTQKES
jgi:spore maturation protein CgeB